MHVHVVLTVVFRWVKAYSYFIFRVFRREVLSQVLITYLLHMTQQLQIFRSFNSAILFNSLCEYQLRVVFDMTLWYALKVSRCYILYVAEYDAMFILMQ